jgi:hypothetical protein
MAYGLWITYGLYLVFSRAPASCCCAAPCGLAAASPGPRGLSRGATSQRARRAGCVVPGWSWSALGPGWVCCLWQMHGGGRRFFFPGPSTPDSFMRALGSWEIQHRLQRLLSWPHPRVESLDLTPHGATAGSLLLHLGLHVVQAITRVVLPLYLVPRSLVNAASCARSIFFFLYLKIDQHGRCAMTPTHWNSNSCVRIISRDLGLHCAPSAPCSGFSGDT